jgi:hypothetical protein
MMVTTPYRGIVTTFYQYDDPRHTPDTNSDSTCWLRCLDADAVVVVNGLGAMPTHRRLRVQSLQSPIVMF